MRSVIFLILISTSFISCNSQVKSEMQKKPIEQVMNENQDSLLSIQGVQGFYQGLNEQGDDCIVVMIDTLTKEIQSSIPDSLDGYQVIIEETGEIKPLNDDGKKPSPVK